MKEACITLAEYSRFNSLVRKYIYETDDTDLLIRIQKANWEEVKSWTVIAARSSSIEEFSKKVMG